VQSLTNHCQPWHLRINLKAANIGQYGFYRTSVRVGDENFGEIAWGKINARDGKLLYMAGGGAVNRGLEKKKGEWMSVFPVPPPPWLNSWQVGTGNVP
jgi:hypothetical protein